MKSESEMTTDDNHIRCGKDQPLIRSIRQIGSRHNDAFFAAITAKYAKTAT